MKEARHKMVTYELHLSEIPRIDEFIGIELRLVAGRVEGVRQ